MGRISVVSVVTDSVADIPPNTAKELGITVVPASVRFGQKVFKENEISYEEFYRKFEEGVPPDTAATAPGEFAEAYRKLVKAGSDTIFSIHASSKLSGIYGSALVAKGIVEKEINCRVIVIDSGSVAMAIGFLAILVAKLAKAKKTPEEIINAVEENIPHIHILAIADTLKYLKKGGRAKKLVQKFGSLMTKLIKPCLNIKNGEVNPVGLSRPHNRQEALMRFIKNFSGVKEIALEYSLDSEGEALRIIKETERAVKSLLPGIPLYLLVHCRRHLWSKPVLAL